MLIPNAPAVGELPDNQPTVPEATYNVRVHKAEYVAIPKGKDAKGPYIKCQLIITGPGDIKQLGRYVFMNYSMQGESAWRLKELLKVTGHPDDFRLSDSDQLLNLEFGALVGVEPGKDGYPDKNNVKRHLAVLPTVSA